MALLINGDTAEVGIFIRKRVTGRDGWVDIVYQPPTVGFLDFVKSLFKRPQAVIRNVPEAGIIGPKLAGSPENQQEVIFLTHGENGGSKFLDELQILQNKTINILRRQLQDEVIRAQAAMEERNKVLKGAKQTQKLLYDIHPVQKPRGRFINPAMGESEEY